MIAAAIDPGAPKRITTVYARLAMATLAGALFVLALPPFSVLPLAILPFAVLAVLLQGLSMGPAIALGFAFGLGQFVPGLFWITESFQVEADWFGWLALPAVLGLSALLSVFPALACAIAAFAARCGLPATLSLATGWTAAEWLRGHLLTGFPWNLAAYALADWTLLAQTASLVGSYGLGFLLVLVSALIGLAVAPLQRDRRLDRAAAAAVLLLGPLGFGTLRLATSAPEAPGGPQIRIVQPNIEQSAKWSADARNANIARLMFLSVRPGALDLLVWPETAWPGLLAEDAGARRALGWLLPKLGVLLTGSPERQEGEGGTVYRNTILAITSDGAVLTSYAKHHLVPFGEYVPLRGLLPLERLVQGLGDFAPGPGPRTLALGPYPYVGAAICYEVIFPGHVVDDAIRPDWIFNATNDAWFGTSIGPWQHLASARMRAVEEGLPLVRAANTGISALIDPYGRTKALLDLGTQGVIDARLPRPLPRTLYARFGDWTAVVLILSAWLIFLTHGRVSLRHTIFRSIS